MSFRLPILFLLSVICYLPVLSGVEGFFVTPSFAQENTPTITSSSQINPQGSDFENFMKNLLPSFKEIPDTLNRVNCSNLPLEACTEINLQTSQVENGTTNTTIKTQATGENKVNKETVGNAAGQYIIASGVHTPPEVANASTDIFSGLIATISKFFENLFDRGEKQAKNYAGTVLPEDVTRESFAQSMPTENSFATQKSNILGAQSGEYAMDRALPLVQCADLPAGLCGDDNKPNFANK